MGALTKCSLILRGSALNVVNGCQLLSTGPPQFAPRRRGPISPIAIGHRPFSIADRLAHRGTLPGNQHGRHISRPVRLRPNVAAGPVHSHLPTQSLLAPTGQRTILEELRRLAAGRFAGSAVHPVQAPPIIATSHGVDGCRRECSSALDCPPTWQCCHASGGCGETRCAQG